MSDIRINALATTASTTASDDYIAIDGSANGTRKLSAYSPTFGGNLTVSGSASVASSNTAGYGFSTITHTPPYIRQHAVETLDIVGGYNGTRILTNGGASTVVSIDSTGLATFGGNLTVSGTGTGISVSPSSGPATISINGPAAGSALYFALSGTTKYAVEYVNASDFFSIGRAGVAYDLVLKSGNLLLGTTTDSSNGKLQLATHTSSAGGIGLGTDTALYRSGPATVILETSIGGTGFRFDNGGAGAGNARLLAVYGALNISSNGANSLYLQTGGTTALTLDSSQNATFAGYVSAATAGDFRLGGLSYSRVAQSDGGGGWLGGYNISYSSGPKHDSTGTIAGHYFSSSGYYLYTGTSQTAGTVATAALTINTSRNATFAGTIATQNGSASTPASASATGTAGTIQWDASYIYVCTATNSWKRAAIATW